MDHGKKPKRSSGKESAESEEDLAGNRRRREGQGWEFGNLGGKAREREGSLAREKEGKEEEKGEKHRAEEASAIRKNTKGNCREESEILFSVERIGGKERGRNGKGKEASLTPHVVDGHVDLLDVLFFFNSFARDKLRAFVSEFLIEISIYFFIFIYIYWLQRAKRKQNEHLLGLKILASIFN